MTFAALVGNVIVPALDGTVVPLLYALAFFFFLYGVVRYFFIEGEEAKEQGRAFAMWGLIGLVVLFTVWGFVRLLLHSFLEPTTPWSMLGL